MPVPSAFDPENPAGLIASSTAEMLASLPAELMLPDGGVPEDRRLSDLLGLYRAVFLNAVDPIVILDRDGRYLEQNGAHARLLGYGIEELAGQTGAMHIGEEQFQLAFAELRNAGVVQREYVNVTRSGERRTIAVSAYAVRDRLGKAVCYVAMKRDITEQRRASDELQRRFEELQVLYGMSEALSRATALSEIHERAMDALQSVVHADRASILEFDDDDVMRFRAWRGLSDRYRAAVEGHSPWKPDARDPEPITVADVGNDPSMDALRDVISREGIRALAFIPLMEGDRLLGKFMLYFDEPHEWTEPELRFAMAVARHVAFAIRRHRREEELRSANQAKNAFLATMSHELRTPLNAIAGYTDLLDADVHGSLSAGQRESIHRVQTNQRHLLRLIDDVLDFAKIESGNLPIEMADVPVQETLEGTRAMLEPQLRARDLLFTFSTGDPLVTCRGDRGKVQQVLANLLANACKFTPAGGTVAIEWQASDEDVRISVTDTGPGIPADKFETIFEPFVQLQTGFRRRVEGTGLGLAISRELARGMGGDVEVTSTLGEGARFTLVLPRE